MQSVSEEGSGAAKLGAALSDRSAPPSTPLCATECGGASVLEVTAWLAEDTCAAL